VREYDRVLVNDPAYADKARRISAMTRDVSEVLSAEWNALEPLLERTRETAAFQSPCTLQHGQAVRGVVESLLVRAGFDLAPVVDPHLCCGSAGTYSLLMPDMSVSLRARKLATLEAGKPQRILTANIGCLSHLAEGTRTPVEHWINAMERRLSR
jgi:glycolate oxidase iron-sulfur subunit